MSDVVFVVLTIAVFASWLSWCGRWSGCERRRTSSAWSWPSR